MNIRTYFAFYSAIFPYIAAIGVLAVGIFGALWGFVLFCTLGLLGGFAGFATFRQNEYYFYYNLGLTKWHLIKRMFVINFLVAIPLFIILTSLFLFLFGGFRIT